VLGASFTLKKNEHVRVDIVYMTLVRARPGLGRASSARVLFLLPACVLLGSVCPGRSSCQSVASWTRVVERRRAAALAGADS
jgi:TRAP-type mannitol/chloroaromatic compound transport system permease small subunit